MIAKPHIYFHRGGWIVAGNADVPWGVWAATRCWCDAMNREAALNKAKGS